MAFLDGLRESDAQIQSIFDQLFNGSLADESKQKLVRLIDEYGAAKDFFARENYDFVHINRWAGGIYGALLALENAVLTVEEKAIVLGLHKALDEMRGLIANRYGTKADNIVTPLSGGHDKPGDATP